MKTDRCVLVSGLHVGRQANSDLSFTDFLKMPYGARSEYKKQASYPRQTPPLIGHPVPTYPLTIAELKVLSPTY